MGLTSGFAVLPLCSCSKSFDVFGHNLRWQYGEMFHIAPHIEPGENCIVRTDPIKYHWRELPRLLSRQKYACSDNSFVAKKLYLSRQNLGHDKYLSRQRLFCRDKSFVATNTSVCRDKNKTFVATKMILVVAPANDNKSYRVVLSGVPIRRQHFA